MRTRGKRPTNLKPRLQNRKLDAPRSLGIAGKYLTHIHANWAVGSLWDCCTFWQDVIVVHPNSSLITGQVEDPETLRFCRDLQKVAVSIHQGMPIAGPWMEARVKMMVRSWLPEGWGVSGPSQMFRTDKPGIRSRSWDIVVHRPLDGDAHLPPQASAEGGCPLLPADAVAVVVDTKTNFSRPEEYAAQAAYNLMNDATESQMDFLGHRIGKIILAASSSRGPDSMMVAAERCGLLAFSLGRYQAGPVADGPRRQTSWRLERFDDGRYPLQEFKAALLRAIGTARSRC